MRPGHPKLAALFTVFSAWSCSSPSETAVRRNALPPADARGSCSFRGDINPEGAATLKLQASVYGEQCANDITQKVCLADAKLNANWAFNDCPATFIAKCPLTPTKSWFLYKGPSSELTTGGTGMQKELFAMSCKSVGKLPELR